MILISPPDSALGQPGPGCEVWGAGMVAPVCPPHMAGVLGQWADTDTLGAMVSLPQSPSTMMAPYVVSLSEVMVFSTSTHSTALATNILVDNLCGLSSSPRSFHTCIVTPESQIPSTMMANADFCGLSNDKVKQRWVSFREIEILLSLSGAAPVSHVVEIINWLDWANFHQFSYWLSNSFEIVGLSNRSSNYPNKEKYVLSVGIEH